MGLDPASARRSVVFAVALLALLVAHHIGDHVLQSDRQAQRKAAAARYGWPAALRAMLGHLFGYHAVVLVVLVGTALALRLPLTWLGVLAGLSFSAVTHGLLDLRWPVRAILRATGSSEFAEATVPVCGMYAADQALHKLALLLSALLVAAL